MKNSINNSQQNTKSPVMRKVVEWTEKEVEMLMNYVEADDSETIHERLDFARYMLHYESGFDFPSRSMYDVKKKFYEECKKRRKRIQWYASEKSDNSIIAYGFYCENPKASDSKNGNDFKIVFKKKQYLGYKKINNKFSLIATEFSLVACQDVCRNS